MAISLAVGIVIFWYTKETQRLRRQSEQQTTFLQDQLAVSHRQVTLFSEQVESAARPFVLCEIESCARGGSAFPPGHAIRAVEAGYRGSLWNPSDRVAHNLRVLVHDHSTGYYWSDEPPVLRKFGEPTEWLASGPLDEAKALSLPVQVYGAERIRFQTKVLEQHRDHDYIAIFFCDVNGNVYASFSLIANLLQVDFRLRLTQMLRPLT